MAGSISSGIGDLGSAVGDIFGAIGSFAEMGAYSTASKIAATNAQLTKTSTKIQIAQQQREAYKIISEQQADVGGAGFAASGSAIDLMRESAQQSALARGLISIQGTVTAGGFTAQAAAYKGQEKAAHAAGIGGIISGVLNIGSAIASIFSDRRLKRDIVDTGRVHRGFKLYRFRYLSSDAVYEGVMADEVQRVMPEAVHERSGFLAVDYGMLGLELKGVVG